MQQPGNPRGAATGDNRIDHDLGPWPGLRTRQFADGLGQQRRPTAQVVGRTGQPTSITVTDRLRAPRHVREDGCVPLPDTHLVGRSGRTTHLSFSSAETTTPARMPPGWPQERAGQPAPARPGHDPNKPGTPPRNAPSHPQSFHQRRRPRTLNPQVKRS
jgi:hypothetical protein